MSILTLWLIFLFFLCLFSYVSFSIVSDDVVNSLELVPLEPDREKYSLRPLSELTKDTEQLLALLNFSRLLLTVPLFLLAFKWTAPFGVLPVLLTLGCLILLLYLFPQWMVHRGSLKAFRVTVQISAYVFYPVFWGLIRISPPKIQAPKAPENGSKANGELQEEQSEEFKGDIIKAISTIGETTVREVMTPRVDMVCILSTATLAELQQFFKEHKFSRLAVYKEKIDNIVGIVSVMDLVGYTPQPGMTGTVMDILRPATFVPETKKVFTLLRELRESHAQMAIVIDEYGGTSGLVTLEDLLEEIVGEIEDEYDEAGDERIEQRDGSYIVTGKFPVERLEELFNIQIAAEDFETVSGLVFSVLGRIPMVGEIVKYKNLEIEILEADKRRIHRLKVHALPQEENAEEVT